MFGEPTPMEDLAIQTRCLDVLRFSVSSQFDLRFEPHLDLSVDYIPEQMARRLTAHWRVPGEVLQDDTVIAEYPASLWDHIKSAFGLKHRTTQVRLNETVCFPDVPLSPDAPNYVWVTWTTHDQ